LSLLIVWCIDKLVDCLSPQPINNDKENNIDKSVQRSKTRKDSQLFKYKMVLWHLLLLHHHLRLLKCLTWLSFGPMLLKFMTSMMAAMPRPGEWNATVGYSSANFFRHNSPVFDGSTRPLAADYLSRKRSLSLGAPPPPS